MEYGAVRNHLERLYIATGKDVELIELPAFITMKKNANVLSLGRARRRIERATNRMRSEIKAMEGVASYDVVWDTGEVSQRDNWNFTL